MSTVTWQRIEGALVGLAALSLAVLLNNGWPLWLWPLVLLAPDLSMMGYAAGPRAGAAIYNTFHLYATGLALILAGFCCWRIPGGCCRWACAGWPMQASTARLAMG